MRLLSSNFKLGVLGGGQLGKMLAQAASRWDLALWILDESRDFPAGNVCTNFVEGNFREYQDVLDFGRQVDVLTIEIESVNSEALFKLQEEGITIHPRPEALAIIQDKGLQKEFFKNHGLPTSPFTLWGSGEAIRQAVQDGELRLPFVQKARKGGYDGRGVAVIRTQADLEKLLPGPSVVEDLVDIDKELAVIAARNPGGQVESFPAVEMVFNPEANLVEWLLCPAQIDPAIEQRAEELARATIEAFQLSGLLAVELFLTPDGEVLVNEVAPRPHNSGHQTIEGCYTSQFEQHLRGILNLPLGSTRIKAPSVMVNLLGEPGYEGPVEYAGFEDCIAIEGVFPHIYGKAITKPYRKMGHVTVIDPDLEGAKEKARLVQQKLKVIA
ncbi:MAG: 5-(carboxyamino)imidazole ribonucleotide synthase [Saprospirales bacterium]|nr:5-(carboxyamino)imidazole ribonucleotide synthase [Saprospirales bacterium]